jgi:hypothetical protein
MLIAALADTAALACWAEAARMATWFVSSVSGSGGFPEILAPLFIAVLAGALALHRLQERILAGRAPPAAPERLVTAVEILGWPTQHKIGMVRDGTLCRFGHEWDFYIAIRCQATAEEAGRAASWAR